jgi:hypothetical protein
VQFQHQYQYQLLFPVKKHFLFFTIFFYLNNEKKKKYIAYETLFKTDLCPATTSNTYGVAFAGFDIRTKKLYYQIYHGKGPQSFSLSMGGYDLGIPYSPAEGVLYPSYTDYQNLYRGNWEVKINGFLFFSLF